MENKIDIVFLYVNGLDNAHIEKRNKYLKEKDKIHNNIIRFEGIDEIIYSVNSVLKNIPWINKIYIVTDNQIPPIDNKLILSNKVIIIDHKQIIPKKYLPTFFSDVIESFLHNIPNLSEIFLYSNDDCFILDKIKKKNIIYCNNNSIGFLFMLSYIGEYFTRNYISAKLLYNKFEITKFQTSHQTKFLRLNTLKKIENVFENELDILRQSKFRNNTSINYLFIAMNYENYINTNTNTIKKLNFDNSYVICGDSQFNLLYFLIEQKIISINVIKKKFICFNNISIKNKQKFIKLMKLLNLIKYSKKILK